MRNLLGETARKSAQGMRHRLRRAMNEFGFDVLKTPTLEFFLQSRRVDLVVDVGANIGQFARKIRSGGYRGHILSIEPAPSVHAALAENARNDDKWTTLNCAVGQDAGKASINLSRNSVFNSLKPALALASSFDAASEVVGAETVTVIALDSLDLPARYSSAFLKIDTQGFEEEVLRGAPRLLSACVGVQLELAVEHLYAGTWQFGEAIGFMAEAGFTPAQIRPVNSITDDPASAIEFDCLFRRSNSSVAPGLNRAQRDRQP